MNLICEKFFSVKFPFRLSIRFTLDLASTHNRQKCYSMLVYGSRQDDRNEAWEHSRHKTERERFRLKRRKTVAHTIFICCVHCFVVVTEFLLCHDLLSTRCHGKNIHIYTQSLNFVLIKQHDQNESLSKQEWH